MKMRMKWVSGVVLCGLCAQRVGTSGHDGSGYQRSCTGSRRAPAQLPAMDWRSMTLFTPVSRTIAKIFIVRGGKIVWSYDDPAARARSATW